MYRKVVVSLVFVSVLTLSLLSDISVPFKTSVLAASEIPNPDHLIVATIGGPDTVDPAWLYDTPSAELVQNVYDTLVNFMVNRSEPDRRDWGYTDKFAPGLATEWVLDDTTDPDHPVYYFKIRGTYAGHPDWGDVKFQNGANLTTEDVEYTFERWFVLDHTGGPQWMIYEPLLYPNYEWNASDPDFGAKVDAAIQRNDTHVWFTFATPYATIVFLQVLAQSFAGILDKDWAIAQGCWDGDFAHWADYHDPDVSALMDPDPVMCGTGPYRFHHWTVGVEWCLEYFPDYWGGWPADGCDDYVETVTEKFVYNWETRKMMFLSGDCDFCYVPRTNIYDLMDSVGPPEVYKPGLRCIHPSPSLSTSGNFYNLDIATTSRYLKPPFTEALAPSTFKDTGIPPNFFNDTNLRKAFSYCVNYTEFLDVAFLGDAIYPATPAIEGLPYRRPPEWYEANQYYLNLTRAEYEFKMAWGGVDNAPGQYDPAQVTPGVLWTNGFKLPLCYNTGNLPRRTIAEDQLKTHVEALNTLFHIDVYEVEWGAVYIPEMVKSELPMFMVGWLADYPDPHNFFYPFMHSTGYFADWQSYSNATVDELIEEGIHETNETRRQEIYYELQEIYIRDAPSVCTYQHTRRHWERDWVQGWYYNPIYPGGYFYHYWKALAPEYPSAQSVDVSVDSITDVDGAVIMTQGGLMWPTVPINVTVTRLDSNANVSSVDVIIGITRTNNETGEYVVIDTQMTSLGINGSFVAEFLWNETGLEPGGYIVGGVVGVVSGYAYDVNATNNAKSDGQVTVMAAARAHIAVVPQEYKACHCHIFTLNLSISNVTDLYLWVVTVEWNSTVLELLNYTEGSFLQQGGSTVILDAGIFPGKITELTCTLLGRIPGVNGSGTLVTLTFNASNIGTTPISITFSDLLDSTETSIYHVVYNGTVTVSETIEGDVDGNFKVDYHDLFLLARAYGSYEGQPSYNKYADFDKDGDVDYHDLFKLSRNYGQPV